MSLVEAILIMEFKSMSEEKRNMMFKNNDDFKELWERYQKEVKDNE